MSDYSWLEPIEKRTREIREETQRIKDETEKMKQETHNLPVPDDAPWLNLSQEEVEELRNKKHELTEYGKQRLKELMRNQEPYPDEFFEEAERREKSNRILQRYNDFYNMECSGLPHGTPITPEHQQMITLQSMIDAIRCEYLNREYNEIAITDIEDLIQRLDDQATAFLDRVRKNNETL
jgi:hypothetical protein